MSANIPNPAPRSRIKVVGGYRNSSPEKKNFKTKSRRSKTPERSLGSLPVFQFSSTDSASEVMVTNNSNKTFYENNRPPRGRENNMEKSRRSRSRERYLEDSLSPQELPVPPLDLPSNSSDLGEDASVPYAQNQWEFQREIGHVRSSTHPSSTRQHKAKFNDETANELMELRMRNEQMEKTLRWWSDCTANWREKWTKVRAERNRAREELKQARSGLEESAKELNVLRQQRGLLVQENKMLRQNETDGKDESASEENSFSSHGIHKESDALPSATKSNKGTTHGRASSGGRTGTEKVDDDHLSQKNAALQLKVDESAKTIQAERDAKLSLNKTIEKQDQEMSALKQKYNELKDAKQDILKQLTRHQDSHRSEVVRINQSLEEELQNRSQMEKKIHDLREEIERLQEENTSEWGRRERLETEKLQLERDNKRLKSVAEEMRTSLEKRRKSVAEDRDNELRKSQTQVHDLNEELNDLRRQASRDQKLLDEKQEELLHSRRRGEQHETEVRQLRNRVEEIKKHQAATEDELDNAQNQSRKLLRVVEEKEEEVEKLQIQIDQIQTRIRREPTTAIWNKTSSYKRDIDNVPSSSESSCEI